MRGVAVVSEAAKTHAGYVLPWLQALLRHMDCESARANRDSVIVQMKRALDVIQYVAADGSSGGSMASGGGTASDGSLSGHDTSPLTVNPADSGISLSQHQITALRAVKDFEVILRPRL